MSVPSELGRDLVEGNASPSFVRDVLEAQVATGAMHSGQLAVVLAMCLSTLVERGELGSPAFNVITATLRADQLARNAAKKEKP